jgi:hypothetical protein
VISAFSIGIPWQGFLIMEAAAVEVSKAAAPDNRTHLEYLTRNTQACVLRPFCFFVSWQGVLTLAYRGFPAPLVGLKQQITDFYQGLPNESPGSKWPKTSLASLKEGKRLTPDQLQRLNQLCREQSGIFQAPNILKPQAVLVDTLSTVVYETRSLERVISRQLMPLQTPADLAPAPAEEFERVQGVVAEADHDEYWFHASRDGNREKHYRSPALGVTLVHELACFKPQQPITTAAAINGSSIVNSSDQGQPVASAAEDGRVQQTLATTADSRGRYSSSSSAWGSALPGIVGKFKSAIEQEFPGLYAWFDERSLHVTVRAVIV